MIFSILGYVYLSISEFGSEFQAKLAFIK